MAHYYYAEKSYYNYLSLKYTSSRFSYKLFLAGKIHAGSRIRPHNPPTGDIHRQVLDFSHRVCILHRR
jgi:hypothetical protein